MQRTIGNRGKLGEAKSSSTGKNTPSSCSVPNDQPENIHAYIQMEFHRLNR